MTTQTASTKCQNIAERRTVLARPDEAPRERARQEDGQGHETREDVDRVEDRERVEDRAVRPRVDPEARSARAGPTPRAAARGTGSERERPARARAGASPGFPPPSGRTPSAEDGARREKHEGVQRRAAPSGAAEALRRPGRRPEPQDRVREEKRDEQHRPRGEDHHHPEEEVRRDSSGDRKARDGTPRCSSVADGTLGRGLVADRLVLREPVLACHRRVGELVRPAHDDRESRRSCGAAAATGSSTRACRPATGSPSAFFPANRLDRKFTTKRSCDDAQRRSAARVIHG